MHLYQFLQSFVNQKSLQLCRLPIFTNPFSLLGSAVSQYASSWVIRFDTQASHSNWVRMREGRSRLFDSFPPEWETKARGHNIISRFPELRVSNQLDLRLQQVSVWIYFYCANCERPATTTTTSQNKHVCRFGALALCSGSPFTHIGNCSIALLKSIPMGLNVLFYLWVSYE